MPTPALPTETLTESSFQADLQRARWDIDFFSDRFLGITPHPGQERLFTTALAREADGVQAAYLTIAVSAGNRAGKTLGLAILILHNTFFKIGMAVPDHGDARALRAWLKAPYDWYHFGILQETAELVFHEIERILSGVHEAQRPEGCPLVNELGSSVIATDRKDRGVYVWVVVHPMFGGGQIHFRTTSEKALGSLGKDMHGISYDECAFDTQLEFVVNEVLHFRRLGTGGQLFLISTSTEGLTMFSDLWMLGDPDSPDRRPSSMSLRISTRENIGYGLNQAMFDRLVAETPDYLIPQNIDGHFIESKSAFFSAQAVDRAFRDDLPADDVAKKLHRYSQGVDPALTYDSTWAIVLDYTNMKRVTGVRARRKQGRQTTLSVASVILDGHRAFNAKGSVCTTALDSTGFGGQSFADLLVGIHPFRAVAFGGTRVKKLRLLKNLKDLLEAGVLIFPRDGLWLALRRQLLGYKTDDRKIEQDAVMALAVAVDVVWRNRRQPAKDTTLDYFGGEADVLPSRERVLGRIALMSEKP